MSDCKLLNNNSLYGTRSLFFFRNAGYIKFDIQDCTYEIAPFSNVVIHY